MRNLCFLTLSFLVMTGCGKQDVSVPKQAPQEPVVAPVQRQPVPAVSQSEAARAHVQQFLDQIMGGDESVKQGLLNHRGHHFGTIESIVITSAVPRSRDGKVVDGFVTVIVKVTGNELPDREIIEKNVTLQVYLKDGQWKVL